MTIQTAALSAIRLSTLNVRRVAPSEIEKLAVSIKADGLIHNLVCYEEDDTFKVVAGGRRYRALKMLEKTKDIPRNHPVAIRVCSKDEAITISMQENFQREKMHSADWVRGFGELRAGGMTVDEIAARFSQPVSFVYQTLRLAALAPELLVAYGKGDMDGASAKALTLTDDHERQVEVFKQCGNNAHRIRAALTSTKLGTQDSLFLFVGREVYEAAGGTVTQDLFAEGDNGYADQPELVEELAAAKMDAETERLKGEGWATVELFRSYPNDLYNRSLVYPKSRDFTPIEQADHDLLVSQIDEMQNLEEMTDEQGTALEELETRLDTLLESVKVFTSEQKAETGVIAYLNRGSLIFHYCRVAKANASGGSSSKDVPEHLGYYSGALYEDLTKIRTQGMQEAVANNPALALDILLDSLSSQLIHGNHSVNLPLALRAEAPRVNVPDDLMTSSTITPVGAIIAEGFGDLPAEGRFASITSMESGDKMKLLAGLVASMLDGVVYNATTPGTRIDVFNEYANAAALDLGSVWSAPVSFFDRMKRNAMLDLLADESGEVAHAEGTKLKKGELAAVMGDRLPANWLPDPIKGFPQQSEDEGEMSEAA